MIDLNLGFTRSIIRECRNRGLPINQTAYVLATAYWETNRTMEPVREAYWLSEDWRRRNLRYFPWYGRGFVQLTWERNYKAMGRRLNMDLTSDPDVVMKPEVSAQILVVGMLEGIFTGKKLSDYLTPARSDYIGARRIVNGTDKAGEIAALAEAYEAALIKGRYESVAPPVENNVRAIRPPRATPAQSTTLQATLVTFLASLGQTMQAAKSVVGQVTESFGVNAEVALFVVAAAALAWVFRERLRKWAEGAR